MKFAEFSKILYRLEQTSSRNEKTKILADFLQKLKNAEIRPVLYLLTGRVVPKYVNREFNFSTKLILRSLARLYSKNLDEITEKYKQIGDLGNLAFELNPHKDSTLQIKDVFQILVELLDIEGQGSVEQKILLVSKLLKKLDGLSSKFVVRIILSRLRLGLNEKTILDALSWAISGSKDKRELLDLAYGVRADLGLIGELALDKKFVELENFKVVPGIPVASKLVERVSSFEEVFKRAKRWVLQPKYDGLRTQIHINKDGIKGVEFLLQKKLFDDQKQIVKIFSRNMEDMTNMFPEIVKACGQMGIQSAVFDAETIGFDEEKKKFIPFQETIQRKRKHGISKKRMSIPVKSFIFDVLYINGHDLTKKSLKYRLAILDKLFSKNGDFIALVKEDNTLKSISLNNSIKKIFKTESIIVNNTKSLKARFSEYVSYGLEGVIVKDLGSLYKPGTRNFDWIKLKASIDKNLVDTIDVVVLGLYYGRGSRAKFGGGAFLVGVFNEENQKFQTIAKIGTGIKDDDWNLIVRDIKKHAISQVPSNVDIDESLRPDIICEPMIVCVVEADEITLSKNHTAGRTKKSKRGFSLRFPRLKQWNRPDKGLYQVTKVKEIKELYEIQKK